MHFFKDRYALRQISQKWPKNFGRAVIGLQFFVVLYLSEKGTTPPKKRLHKNGGAPYMELHCIPTAKKM